MIGGFLYLVGVFTYNFPHPGQTPKNWRCKGSSILAFHPRPWLFMKLRRKLSLMSALLGVLLLAGCATPPMQVSPENIVRQRAKARWDALIAGDTEKAYQFLHPAYRAVRDLKFYQASVSPRAAQWTGVDVIGVECKADVCSARIRIDFKVVQGMASRGAIFDTHYDEQWIIENGSWWLYERP